MRIIRKLLALLVVAVITVLAVTVTSFASPYDEAIAIDSGETVEGTIFDINSSLYYEITAKSSGTLTVNWSYGSSWSWLYVYNEDGAYIPVETLEVKAGSLQSGGEENDYIKGKWNRASEKFSATSTYKVSKGTYYIQLQDDSFSAHGDHKLKLSATYPTESNDVKISYLGLTMKKGDTLQLSAILTGGKEKTTWTSSKKKVASITSSGKVTAKKKGSTIITAKCGDSVVKLKITVK